ncbi:MAG: class I SAM-dependent methyltransferase [Bacilli bacterium]|nr:class I SAM-dependent methyltransferase [Bacilli bacterium]
MKVIKDFEEYKLLDMADGMKLELWNGIKLLRPDPQIIWPNKSNPSLWNDIDAIYHRSKSGGGSWEIINPRLNDKWDIHYKDLTFNLKLMGFKHTGLFPEQAYNWDLIMNTIKKANREVKVLNLFAYTGGASIAALKAGASVVHVDSSRGMVDWAKTNAESSGIADRPIRYIVDDVRKFVKREINRGNKYDIILMDPPSFGRGSKSEVWNIETDLYNLVDMCSQILSDDPLLFIINSYTSGFSKTILESVLRLTIKKKGVISSAELCIPMENSDLLLPCGSYTRWEKE